MLAQVLLTRKVRSTQSNYKLFRKNSESISKKSLGLTLREWKKQQTHDANFAAEVAIVYLRRGLHVTRKPGIWRDQTPCHHHVRYVGLWWTDYEWRGLLPERRTGTGTCLPRCKRHETRDRIILSILGPRLFYVARATGKQNSAEAVDDRPRIYADAFKARAEFDSQSGRRAVIYGSTSE